MKRTKVTTKTPKYNPEQGTGRTPSLEVAEVKVVDEDEHLPCYKSTRKLVPGLSVRGLGSCKQHCRKVLSYLVAHCSLALCFHEVLLFGK